MGRVDAPRGGTARRRCAGRRPRTRRPGCRAVDAVTAKPGGRLGDRVEVAHPHLLVVGWSRRTARRRRRSTVEVGAAVLAPAGLGDVAAEVAGEELGAVADAEDRDAERRRRPGRSPGAPSTWTDFGPPREDQRRRPARGQLGGGDRVGHDLAVDVRLADPAGDELGVLGAEVDDEDGPVLGGDRVGRRLMRGPRRAPRRARPSGTPSASRSRTTPSTCAGRPIRLVRPSWSVRRAEQDLLERARAAGRGPGRRGAASAWRGGHAPVPAPAGRLVGRGQRACPA